MSAATRVGPWLLLAVACGGSNGGTEGGSGDSGAASDAPGSDAAVSAEAGAEGGGPGGDAGEGGSLDGTPTRTASCTPLSKQTGTAVSSYHGRMDGTLTYVLPQGGQPSCNGDYSHVHLQVEMNGSIYDVAVDIGDGSQSDGVLIYESNLALPDGAWSEGWHATDGLSYTGLGLTSSQFTAMSPAELSAKITSELQGVNHVSIFCVGYTPGDNGCHDVHYEDDKNDGALVIEPLSPTAHVLFFHFSDDSF